MSGGAVHEPPALKVTEGIAQPPENISAFWPRAEQENDPKPSGIELDHECHNQAIRDGLCLPGICAHRLCCNPRHLIPRTRAEHVAASPGRASEVRRNGRKRAA
jgi:hypothetical protein